MGWTLNVTQLNEYVRRQLAADPVLNSLSVEGEISGFKVYSSGHMYFTLKDDKSKVQCVMFRQHNLRLKFMPRDGLHVRIQGSASLYPATGSFQIYAESMEEAGYGRLYQEFCLLKEKLEAEGLFDPAIKKPLPFLPKCVGIATSLDGAVLHDILNVGWRRDPYMEFIIAPCGVQGMTAAAEIVDSIKALNVCGKCDVILCGRGGGSMEDLWPFNEESVAREIRASSVPVVSCVGHETDFTIADFAADMRCPTPSAAAETVVPKIDDMIKNVDDSFVRIRHMALNALENAAERLDRYAEASVLRLPWDAFAGPRSSMIEELNRRLSVSSKRKLERSDSELAKLEAKLDAFGTGSPLEKGYALIEKDGHIVEKINEIKKGDRLKVIMSGGSFAAEVGDTDYAG